MTFILVCVCIYIYIAYKNESIHLGHKYRVMHARIRNKENWIVITINMIANSTTDIQFN